MLTGNELALRIGHSAANRPSVDGGPRAVVPKKLKNEFQQGIYRRSRGLMISSLNDLMAKTVAVRKTVMCAKYNTAGSLPAGETSAVSAAYCGLFALRVREPVHRESIQRLWV
jgi:hypothetical protein